MNSTHLNNHVKLLFIDECVSLDKCLFTSQKDGNSSTRISFKILRHSAKCEV